MDNSETNNLIEETPDFNFESYAKGLIWAGIIGMILSSIMSWYLVSDVNSSQHFFVESMEQVKFLLIYYWLNTGLVMLSGFLLFFRKKIGVLTLLFVFISIILSMLIPLNDVSNLFNFTVSSSLVFFIFGAPVGVIFFLGAVTVNVFRIKKWDQIT